MITYTINEHVAIKFLCLPIFYERTLAYICLDDAENYHLIGS